MTVHAVYTQPPDDGLGGNMDELGVTVSDSDVDSDPTYELILRFTCPDPDWAQSVANEVATCSDAGLPLEFVSFTLVSG